MAKLYFHYSTMNAGKSTLLLQAAHNYHEGGMQTYLLTARLDRRAGQGRIASRIGIGAEAEWVRSSWQRLHDAHALVLDSNGQIRMANPFSAVETRYRVHAGGRCRFRFRHHWRFGSGCGCRRKSLPEM